MDLDFCWEDQDVWMDGFQKIFLNQRPEMGAHERSKAMVFRIFAQWRDWLSRTLDVNSSHSRLAEALDIALRQQSHLKTKVESKTKKEQPEGTEVTAKPFVSLECVVKREGTLSSRATEPQTKGRQNEGASKEGKSNDKSQHSTPGRKSTPGKFGARRKSSI
eukprot:Cvel_24550.t1-p1 / transcript=Cvel_24550.t1 / gene=Cvel_24550 / organism=Chromera_velia_CCMP2878 / gene_product=hypothetical protein / transcript_product=hypothetical protein / location=Cvel_scaffold2668:304-2009(-) / protein_length=161 / sequence_SO=supercontig / SO=protein_coding / is_pseudo=false